MAGSIVGVEASRLPGWRNYTPDVAVALKLDLVANRDESELERHAADPQRGFMTKGV